MSHWTQRASKQNMDWLKRVIAKQESKIISLIKLQSHALTSRGISKEKLIDYLEALEAEGIIIVDREKKVINKLDVSVSENTESQSKII